MTESAQNADFRRKPQIFADSPLLLEIPASGGRRKPQIFAGNRRFSQKTAGNRRLGSVTKGLSPLARPYKLPVNFNIPVAKNGLVYISPCICHRPRSPATTLGVPPWSLFLSKNYCDFEASSLGILVFRGTLRPIFYLILTLFGPNADLFRWADLTYFHLFRPIHRADLT